MSKAVLLTGLLLSLAGITSSAAPDEDKEAAANAKARMEAAQKVYKGMIARSKVDVNARLNFELLHRWSTRWMEAEAELGTKKDQVAAVEAHLARMRDLEKAARNMRFIASYEVAEAEFYRLDAEKRLRSVKKK